MPLSAGLRLGPYQVQTPIGAGGMGEVYKGLDTRLGRTVAIKVLPPELVAARESRQRLEREARSLSRLSHPHICTLYDIGHQEGVDFLVMEYLEGETLERRLRRGPLRIAQALSYAIEVASALENAHHLGIIHRDLKPGNIMITKSGIKLLDFGLAKLQPEPAPMAIALTEMATETRKLTAQGMLLGTLQYMAPEQLEAKDVDARTDIFAFGAVLYEMITGHPAFTGQSKASLIAAVLSSEPAAISSRQPLSPPFLDAVVKNCLAKEPDERWQTAYDVKLQLQWVLGAASQAAPSAGAVKHQKKTIALACALVVLVALISSLLTIAYLRGSSKQAITLITFIPPPENTTFESLGDLAGPPVLSPDGRFLAFVGASGGKNQLWVRALDSENAQPLGNTEGATFPFWSPDSRSIGFFANRKLNRIDLSSGSVTALCDAPLGRGGAWSKDGVILFAPDFRTGLFKVSASGGEPIATTKLDSTHNTNRWPYFLPDGKRFLYLASNQEAPKGAETAVYLGSLDGQESRLLLRSFDNAAYSKGYLFFMRNDILMAQRFDLEKETLVGEPVVIATNVLNDINTWSAVFSVSEGLLAYQSAAAVGTQLTWLDRRGKQLGTTGERDRYDNIRISPQADRVAISLGSPQDIWIYDVARDVKTRFTFNPQRDGMPLWSPDGSQIIFTSEKRGHPDLYRKAANGEGPEVLLLESDSVKLANDWSPDGRFVLFEELTASSREDVWVLPLFGDRKPFPLVQSPFNDNLSVFSPDGRWVAYTSDESGTDQVYVVPFRAGGDFRTVPFPRRKWQISTAGGHVPIWRRDGKEILYQDLQGYIVSAEVSTTGAQFRVGEVRPLFKLPPNTGFDVTPDGKRILIKALGDKYSSPVTLLVNWSSKLRH